jgi:signal transduction histidine kinase/ActR/RegA family two-component response regulator
MRIERLAVDTLGMAKTPATRRGRSPVRIVAALTALLLSVAFFGTIWRYEHAEGQAQEARSNNADRMRDLRAAAIFWHEREAINEYLITGSPATLKEVERTHRAFSHATTIVFQTDQDFPQLLAAKRANDRLVRALEGRSGPEAVKALHPYEEAVLAPLRTMNGLEGKSERARSAAALAASHQARIVAMLGAALALIAGLSFAVYVGRLLRRVTRQAGVLEQTLAEREQTYSTLQEREQQLRQAQKTEAVGRLAGGIAHDFNNLLLVMTGHGALALDELAPGPGRVRHSLEQIVQAAGRAAALTSQLLAFSRQQVLQKQIVDVNRLVTGLTEMLRPLIGSTIDLVVDLDPRTGSVEADAGQLEQVITNLVVNGRDAIPGGGRIAICTRPVAAPELPHGLPPGGYCVVTVTDSGDGMDEETRARAFDPFFTTKEQGKGTGLGLATVHGIVAQSGGDVRIESMPGAGTTIAVYLPSTDAAAAASVAEAPSLETGGSETVLLVEDDPVIRSLLADVLVRDGYDVIAAGNGSEALALVESGDLSPELLITDMAMPGMGGLELAGLLQPRYPSLRVICMSGYNHDTALSEAADSGQIVFLQKPFTPAEILRTTHAVLAAETLIALSA